MIVELQTFGIAKGNIQSVLTLVIRDPGGKRGNNHTFYGDVPLKDWLIDWMGFNATFSSISAISWRSEGLKTDPN